MLARGIYIDRPAGRSRRVSSAHISTCLSLCLLFFFLIARKLRHFERGSAESARFVKTSARARARERETGFQERRSEIALFAPIARGGYNQRRVARPPRDLRSREFKISWSPPRRKRKKKSPLASADRSTRPSRTKTIFPVEKSRFAIALPPRVAVDLRLVNAIITDAACRYNDPSYERFPVRLSLRR